jgi:hypothetical protein
MLSRVVNFLRKGGVAIGTVSGRSQQPRPDHCQDLLQRQSTSFLRRKVDGQYEQVSDGIQDKMMMKAAPGSALEVIESQIIFGTLEILFNVPT